MEALGPILTTLVALAVGYFVGGLGQRRRRKSSLVDERLRAIDEALSLLDTLRVRLVRDQAQAIALYSENGSIVGAGIAAADALAGPELGLGALGTRIREALALVEPFDPDDRINDQIGNKLAEARREYEALRTKLV